MVRYFACTLIVLSLVCRGLGQTVLFTQSNLPIIKITASQEIPDEPKITVIMQIIYNGPGQINLVTDPANVYDGLAGIERRGSTSQDLSPKKPYSIELRDSQGGDSAVSLLGMPAESDWALIAPYSDKSLIRDALAFILAGKLMEYSPRVRLCELTLNDQYMGVYVLTEKIKRDPNRVDISNLTTTDISGDELTGGYIIKIDKGTGGAVVDGWSSSFAPFTFYQYHYPKAEDIRPEQKNYIKAVMDQFEQVMASANYMDPSSGYANLVDMNSFIDFMIVNEVARNVDGYRLSTFLYKDKNSKDSRIKMGPVWDFNIAFGNANYCRGSDQTGFAYDFGSTCPNDFWQVPFWWARLTADSTFRKATYDRWTGVRQGVLSDQKIMEAIDSMTFELLDASARNFQRWPILNDWIWPNNFVGGSYSAEISYLKNWVLQRTAWLDQAFAEFNLPLFNPELTKPPVFYYSNLGSPSTPFDEVTFAYYVHDYDDVEIRIFDPQGRIVNTLIDRQHENGLNSLVWTNPGIGVGIFYYQVRVNTRLVQTGRFYTD